MNCKTFLIVILSTNCVFCSYIGNETHRRVKNILINDIIDDIDYSDEKQEIIKSNIKKDIN